MTSNINSIITLASDGMWYLSTDMEATEKGGVEKPLPGAMPLSASRDDAMRKAIAIRSQEKVMANCMLTLTKKPHEMWVIWFWQANWGDAVAIPRNSLIYERYAIYQDDFWKEAQFFVCQDKKCYRLWAKDLIIATAPERAAEIGLIK